MLPPQEIEPLCGRERFELWETWMWRIVGAGDSSGGRRTDEVIDSADRDEHQEQICVGSEDEESFSGSELIQEIKHDLNEL